MIFVSESGANNATDWEAEKQLLGNHVLFFFFFFYDAIRTCCDEKFKLLTTELFSGTPALDMDVL